MLNGKLNSMIIGKLIKNGEKLYHPINKQIIAALNGTY
jgi:hypothetical protein